MKDKLITWLIVLLVLTPPLITFSCLGYAIYEAAEKSEHSWFVWLSVIVCTGGFISLTIAGYKLQLKERNE